MRDTGHVVLARVMRTTNALERMRGLLWRPPPGPEEGLLIAPCGAVHTAGMRYAIDLAFLDREMRVRKLVSVLAPWRTAACKGAHHTLELRSGALAALPIRLSQCLEWQDIG